MRRRNCLEVLVEMTPFDVLAGSGGGVGGTTVREQRGLVSKKKKSDR